MALWFFHSGCCGASAFTRSMANRNWKYNGCSAQSVPSLSNVAMRSGTGTKSDEPSFVTRSTKATIPFFGAVSFHDGKGISGGPSNGRCERQHGGERGGDEVFCVCVFSWYRSKLTAAGYDRTMRMNLFLVITFLELMLINSPFKNEESGE